MSNRSVAAALDAGLGGDLGRAHGRPVGGRVADDVVVGAQRTRCCAAGRLGGRGCSPSPTPSASSSSSTGSSSPGATVERLFGVSKARAATLMQTFGAELVGNQQRTPPRTKRSCRRESPRSPGSSSWWSGMRRSEVARRGDLSVIVRRGKTNQGAGRGVRHAASAARLPERLKVTAANRTSPRRPGPRSPERGSLVAWPPGDLQCRTLGLRRRAR